MAEDRGTLRCQRCYGTAEEHGPNCALVSAQVHYRALMSVVDEDRLTRRNADHLDDWRFR